MQRLFRGTFLRHGIWALGASVTLNACNYAYHVSLSRFLGPSGYGALSAIVALLAISAIPSGIVSTIVAKYAAEFHALGELGKTRTLTTRLICYAGGAGLLVIAVGFAVAPFLERYLHISDSNAIAAAIVLTGANLVLPGVRAILQGMQRFERYTISVAVEGVLKVVLGVTFALIGGGLFGAIAGYAVGTCASLAVTAIVVYSALRVESAPLFLDLRRLLSTSTNIALASASLTVLGIVDVILVKHYFAATDAGMYSAVALAGKTLPFALGFISVLLFPKAAAQKASGESPRPVLIKALGALSLIVGVALLFFGLGPRFVLDMLTGPKFAGAAYLLFPYGAAMAMFSVTSLLTYYSISTHRFAFVVPLAAATVLEVVLLSAYHPTLQSVIGVLIVVHALGLGSVAVALLNPLRAKGAILLAYDRLRASR